MALSGKLDADFADFYGACQRAVVELKGFDTETKNVEKALGRMTDDFSGRKIQTEAALMAEAVERVGGASKLTETELARVGNTAAEAVAKMRALGQDVPKGLEDLAKHAKTADTSLGSMSTTVRNLATDFLAMFSARAVFNFVGQILDSASALQDLSNQTQISVEEIQLLAGAMSEFGVDADTLAKGLFTLSRKIAGGDDAIDVALRKMGMSLAEVAGLQGEELFLKMEHGLSTLKGSLRDEVAATLFGNKLGMAMAGAANEIEGTLNKARALTTVIGGESVAALDTYGETIERAEKNFSALAANMIGPVAAGFNVLFDAATKGASVWNLAMGLLPKGLGLVGTGVEGLTTAIDHANLAAEENAAKTRAAAGETAAWQGPLQQTKAELKATADELARVTKADELWIDGLHAAAAEAELYASILTNVLKTGIADTAAVDTKATADLTKNTNARVASILAEQAARETLAQRAVALRGTEDALTAAWSKQATELAKLEKEKVGDIDVSARQQVIYDDFTGTLYKEATAQDAAAAAAANATQKHEETAAATDKATKAAGVYMNQLHMLVSDPMLAGFFDSSGIGATLYGGGTSGVTPEEAAAMAAGQFIQRAGVGNVARPPGRAGGGPVSAGRAYIVGERQPELFIPSSSGTIATGVGASVVNHIYVNGTAEEVARKVSAEILRTVMAGTKVR